MPPAAARVRSPALIRRSLADQPAHEGDELIDFCRCSVETGLQANDAAAAPREADSGRRQGLDGL